VAFSDTSLNQRFALSYTGNQLNLTANVIYGTHFVIDGWEATRRLKGNPQTHDIPVIALSAHALAGEAMAAGCDEFDTKPIEFERLVATVRRLLAHP
jgi:CheY-like chemotaxis protein